MKHTPSAATDQCHEDVTDAITRALESGAPPIEVLAVMSAVIDRLVVDWLTHDPSAFESLKRGMFRAVASCYTQAMSAETAEDCIQAIRNQFEVM